MTSLSVESARIAPRNEAPIRPEGDYVLYWMIAARRPVESFALQHARDRARELGKPLVILEALRLDYPHASQRLHTFVLEGMFDNLCHFAGTSAHYLPYVERAPGEGRGLMAALAARACLVVTDDYPTFFLPRMVGAFAGAAPVRVEAVDGLGSLPLSQADRDFSTAHGFRRTCTSGT